MQQLDPALQTTSSYPADWFVGAKHDHLNSQHHMCDCELTRHSCAQLGSFLGQLCDTCQPVGMIAAAGDIATKVTVMSSGAYAHAPTGSAAEGNKWALTGLEGSLQVSSPHMAQEPKVSWQGLKIAIATAGLSRKFCQPGLAAR